jgi:hypothetical protein
VNDADCKPYICPFPDPGEYHAGDRWVCPNCGSVYRLSRPKPERWWRNWYAEHGYWRLVVECHHAA